MHTKECVRTCTCPYTHAFYQSNLIGKSMLWLANRELMQSRGLSSPLPTPSCLNLYLSVSLMSFSSPLVFPLSFPLSLFLLKTTKQHLHPVCRQAVETHGQQIDGLSDSPCWIFLLLANSSLTFSVMTIRKTGVSSFSSDTDTLIHTFND